MKDIIYAGFSQLSYLNWHNLNDKYKGFKLKEIFGEENKIFNQIKTTDYKKMETDGQDYYIRIEEGKKIYTATDARSFYLYSEDIVKAEQNPLYPEFGDWEFIWAYDHHKILQEFLDNKQKIRISHNDSGFQASVFRKENQVIIAYRGTNPTSMEDWLKTNADFSFGVVPDALNCAVWLYEKVATDPILRECEIHVTGHSMGGAMAQYIATYGYNSSKPIIYITDTPFCRAVKKTVTWNALGVGKKNKFARADNYKKLHIEKFKEFYDLAFNEQERIINYYLEYDLVPDILCSVGKNICVDNKIEQNSRRGNHKSNALAAYHSVSNFLPFFDGGNIIPQKLSMNFIKNSFKQVILLRNESQKDMEGVLITIKPKDYLKDFNIKKLRTGLNAGDIYKAAIDKKNSGENLFYHMISSNYDENRTDWYAIKEEFAEIGLFNNMDKISGVVGGEPLKIELPVDDSKKAIIYELDGNQIISSADGNFREGKLLIGNIQIGNSASLVQIEDNMWEEDLGSLYIKYYYDSSGKDLIIEWEKR